ncbi:MAG TPA: PIN domain-containing protein [Thermodesulfobacteriota bacterium]|nr:PIN domain-containing protein [Thermodesulfobacteriota bacterium]
MIFLDSSAIYALADKADPNHDTAYKKFDLALKSGETFLLHNYILLESAALLQVRLGPPSAVLFLKDAKSFEVEWVDLELHEGAVKELERTGKRGVSLVDCTSFLVMRRRGVQKVLAFDPDFQDQGFTIY